MSERLTHRRRGWYVRAAFFVLPLFALPPAAGATTLGFDCITGNNATSCAIGEAQLWVDVADEGDSVLFHFYNTGPSPSSITDVYFDDGGVLQGPLVLEEGPNVAFSAYARPRDLPGGDSISPDFDVSEGFSADSDSPVAANGVNPNEYLDISFGYVPGMDFDDVLAALNSGELRIGIHVQAYANGESESFVNNTPIPEPGTLVLLAAGGVGLIARRRRRERGRPPQRH